MSRTSLKIERLTVIGLASVASVKEPTVLQRKELRLTLTSEKGSKSIGRSNCVANHIPRPRQDGYSCKILEYGTSVELPPYF